MDFSSIPSYLDPSNWQQTPSPQHQHQHQQINHHGGSSSNSINPNSSNPRLPPPPLQMSAQPQPPMGGPGGSIRPGSMAERARMANIPMPEAALKCPRCESTNTKFCYFNNYNLSQPRHFCKTCRRYWTRGGALRSVPVGGGCRRNKRSKSSSAGASSSKSGSSSAAATSSASSALSSGGGGMSGTSSVADILGLTPPPLSALRFMNNTPLHHLTSDFGGSGLGLSGNYGGIPGAGDLGFQLGSIGMEHWRIPAPPPPQFPFLSALDAAAGAGGSGLYGHPYEGAELSSLGIGHVRSKGPAAETSGAVKMEESSRREMSSGSNLARQFSMGNAAGEHYNWGGVGGGGGGGSSSSGNAWTDMSGLNNNSACSTTSAL